MEIVVLQTLGSTCRGGATKAKLRYRFGKAVAGSGEEQEEREIVLRPGGEVFKNLVNKYVCT